MSHSGVSRYDFGLLFGIDHGDKPKVAKPAEPVAVKPEAPPSETPPRRGSATRGWGWST